MLTHNLLLQISLLQRQIRGKTSFIKSVFLSLSRLFLFFSMACLGMATSAEARAEETNQEKISETENVERRRSWVHISPARPSSAQSLYSAQEETSNLNSMQREMQGVGDQLLNANLDEMAPLVGRLHAMQKREQLFKRLTQEEERLRSQVLTTELGDMAPLAERLHEVREQRRLLLSSQTAENTQTREEIGSHAGPSTTTMRQPHPSSSSMPAISAPTYASLTSDSDVEQTMPSSSNRLHGLENEQRGYTAALIHSDIEQQAIPAEGMEFIFPTISLESSSLSSSTTLLESSSSSMRNHTDSEIESAAEDEFYATDASVTGYYRESRQTIEKAPLNKHQVDAATQTNDPLVKANAVELGAAREDKNANANAPISVSNVAPGVISPSSTGAVNGAQLFGSLAASKQYTDQRFLEVQQNINQVARNAYGGIAAAMAMPNQTPQQNGNTVVAVGGANFRGQSAVGFGVTHRSRNGQFLFHGAASTAGAAGAGVRLQLGYEF